MGRVRDRCNSNKKKRVDMRLKKVYYLKQIAMNTGSNLPDMKNDSDTYSRKDRVNRAFTTPPMKPKAYDMTLMDDTPFETPHYENPIASELSHRIHRRLDSEEQEEVDLINKQEQQIENTKEQLNIWKNYNLKDDISV